MGKAVASVVAALALLGACGGAEEPPPGGAAVTSSTASPGVPRDEPPWRPVDTAVPAAAVPSARPSPLSLAEARGEAVVRSRLGGEQFALDVAHLVLDAQPDVDGESVLAAVASRDLDRATRDYLIEDLDGQRQLGTERLLDPTLETWIRSSVTGPASEPSALQVEVMGNLASEPLDVFWWYSTRYDVAWQDGRWQLVAFYDATYGPQTRRNLTPGERREFLTGPGWRRIPPAD